MKNNFSELTVNFNQILYIDNTYKIHFKNVVQSHCIYYNIQKGFYIKRRGKKFAFDYDGQKFIRKFLDDEINGSVV